LRFRSRHTPKPCSERRWEYLDVLVQAIRPDSFEFHLYLACSNVYHENYDVVQKHVQSAFELLLDGPVSILASESYSRAYSSILQAQWLVEIEECAQYKQGNGAVRAHIRNMWAERLNGVAPPEGGLDSWQQTLNIRSLVLDPSENIGAWLEFAAICHKRDRLSLSLQILTMLVGHSPLRFIEHPEIRLDGQTPQLTYTYIKHLHQAGYREQAFERLMELVAVGFNRRVGEHKPIREGLASFDRTTLAELQCRVLLTAGKWKMAEVEFSPYSNEWKAASEVSLDFLKRATACEPENPKAWHRWSMLNFQVIDFFGK